jgi:aminoglycoside phosphotransferase (APT) family kinase protein
MAARLGETFIDRLADLHAVDYTAIGLGDLGRPEGYIERQVKGWIERYSGSKTHELPDVETVSGWLRKNIPVQSAAALIHNDYKFDNIVLDASDITQVKGVLDWEMCTIGDPLADLGTAVAYWIQANDPPELQAVHWGPTAAPGSLTRKQIIDRYAARTGRDVTNMIFYYVFALFKTGVIVQQIYYRYHHGLTQDRRFASLLDVNKTLLRTAVRSIERNTL